MSLDIFPTTASSYDPERRSELVDRRDPEADLLEFLEQGIADDRRRPQRADRRGMRQSRINYYDYVDERNAVKQLEKVEGAELLEVQESVRGWLEAQEGFISGQDYGTNGGRYDRKHVESKILGLTDYLRQNHADKVHELELTATRSFVSSAFDMYEDRKEDGSISHDADGSFAFIVPARMSRRDKDYGQEVEPVIPALRYVPNELRAQMMIGLPPFVIDTYKAGPDGKRGYLVLAPIFADMFEDMTIAGASAFDKQKVARAHVNAAVDFAHQRLGVTVAGLGAIIPSLTNYGKAVTNPNVVITNGHGGTAYLVKETAQKAIDEGLVDYDDHPLVGVLGLGAIGASIAHLAARDFQPPINIYDTDESRVNRVQGSVNRSGEETSVRANEADLIEASDVVISAVTDRIKLSRIAPDIDMTGRVIVDDSQPGAFNPNEVKAHGGTVIWVIGRSENGDLEREGYDYGTMVDEKRDLFGCEAEAGSLYRYMQELEARGMPRSVVGRIIEKVAVRDRVTPDKANLIGALFVKYGIGPAPFQAFGQLVEKPKP